MEIDFSKSKTGEGSVSVTEQSAPPTQTPTMAITAPSQRPSLSEVILPRLNLVAATGLLKDSFPVGSYVYRQEQVLYTPPQINVKTQTVERAGSPPLSATFLDIRPIRYFEKLDGGARGDIFETEDQVRAAGGTTNWKEWDLKKKDGMKRFVLGCDCLIAIERPEMAADDGTTFVFKVNDQKYALAMYNMKGDAFTSLKGSVNTARVMGCLIDGISVHSWALSSRLKPTKDRSSTYWSPVLVPHKPTSPEFRDWAASVLAAPQRETDDAAE